jgi:hypothetical protein
MPLPATVSVYVPVCGSVALPVPHEPVEQLRTVGCLEAPSQGHVVAGEQVEDDPWPAAPSNL